MAAAHLAEDEPLRQPAAVVMHEHALRLVQETGAAVARLADKNDVHALHDARVALRRLRGWLRAFARDMPVKRRQRRRLRELARATNTARDAEVSLEWLGVLQPGFDPRARAGIRGFSSSLAAIRDENYGEVRRDLPEAWRRLSRKLETALRKTPKDPRPFRAPFGASLQAYLDAFTAALGEARRDPSAVPIHRLRIAGKKLRYLLETILPWHPEHDGLVQELKALHELAGSIQDLQRLMALSEHAFQRQAGRRYRKLLETYRDPGARENSLRQPDLSTAAMPLLWICRGAGQVQAQRMQEFRRRYLGRSRPAFMQGLRDLCRGLERPVKA